jgi:hypothetical protein
MSEENKALRDEIAKAHAVLDAVVGEKALRLHERIERLRNLHAQLKAQQESASNLAGMLAEADRARLDAEAELMAARKALEEIRGRPKASRGRLMDEIFAEYDEARQRTNA